MSYAHLGRSVGYGAVDPAIVRPPACTDAPASGGYDYCVGYEQTCPAPDGGCCPPESWRNDVYREILGGISARAIAEQKVRRAGQLLLHATYEGGQILDPSGIDKFAWDYSASVPEGLVDRVRTAFMLFESCFPGGRWHFDDRDKQTEECGWYGAWDENSTYYPDARIRALEVLSGEAMSTAFKTALRQKGLGRPAAPGATPSPRLATVLALAAKAIESVPGNRPDQFVHADSVYIGARPDRPAGRGGPGQPRIRDLLSVENGVVVPSQWLSQFTTVFTPKPIAARPGVRPAPAPKPPLGPLTPPRPMPVPSPPRFERGGELPPGVGAKAGAGLLVAAGAALVGVGVYTFVRVGRL